MDQLAQFFAPSRIAVTVFPHENTVQFEYELNQHTVFRFGYKEEDGKVIFTLNDPALQNVILFKNITRDKSFVVDFNNIGEMSSTITKIIAIITDIFSYCIGCYERVPYQSGTFVTCGKDDCVNKFEELLIGDPVTELAKKNPSVFEFLVDSGFSAATSSRASYIFEPFPKFFLKDQSINMKRGELSKLNGVDFDSSKDFTRLKIAASKKNIQSLIIDAASFISDEEMRMNSTVWDIDTYMLVRFIITSSKLSINPDMSLSDHFQHLNRSVKVFRVIHPSYVDHNFLSKKGDSPTVYMFHGSGCENWFSITRNGLKICSNSGLMTTGAAHGPGKYFSDDINLSYSYGQSRSSGDGNSYVAVYEIIGTKEEYLKSKPIHVVNYEDRDILRFLIIFDSKSSSSSSSSSSKGNINEDFNIINQVFNHRIYETSKSTAVAAKSRANTKLVIEYKRIKKYKVDEKEGFTVAVTKGNILNWKFILHNFPEGSQISKDLNTLTYGVKETVDGVEKTVQKKYDGIEVEVNFPQDYPISPPFVRVVRPRFAYQTGHITSEGALCMEVLTKSGWKPTVSMETLMVIIKVQINEGGGRLDPDNHSNPYCEARARQSFSNVARSHGWE